MPLPRQRASVSTGCSELKCLNLCRLFQIAREVFQGPGLLKDTLAERLRRRPAKPMWSPRVGSNPTGVVCSLCACVNQIIYVCELYRIITHNITHHTVPGKVLGKRSVPARFTRNKERWQATSVQPGYGPAFGMCMCADARNHFHPKQGSQTVPGTC